MIHSASPQSDLHDLLIPLADQQSRPVVIIILCTCFSPYVRPHFSKYRKTNVALK